MTETTQPAPLAIIGADYDIMFVAFTPAQVSAALRAAVLTYDERCRHWENCMTELTAATDAQADAIGTPAFAAARQHLQETRAATRHAQALCTEQGKLMSALIRAERGEH